MLLPLEAVLYDLTKALARGAVRKFLGDNEVNEVTLSAPGEVGCAENIEVVDVVETTREEEPIGQDIPKRCDNRKSKSEAKFTIRASRTWRRQCTMQTEKIHTEGSTAAVGFNKIVTANLQETLQKTMHESFSATDEIVSTFEQSFEVIVPPGALQTVVLAWKKIWQLGYIRLLVGGIQVDVPFKMLVDIDYDQIHETISSV
jgi:hypothetical protein